MNSDRFCHSRRLRRSIVCGVGSSQVFLIGHDLSVECRTGSAMSRSAEAATTVIIGLESGTDNYKESE
jgi:hypothetical protein